MKKFLMTLLMIMLIGCGKDRNNPTTPDINDEVSVPIMEPTPTPIPTLDPIIDPEPEPIPDPAPECKNSNPATWCASPRDRVPRDRVPIIPPRRRIR